MAALIGKWISCPELTTGSEEFETAFGTPPLEKGLWRNLVVTLDILRDGDSWKHVTTIDAFPYVQTFKSGEPFTYKLDGKQNMRSNVIVQDDKFIERIGVEQDDGSYKEWDVVTEMEGERLKMTQTFNGAVQVVMMKKV